MTELLSPTGRSHDPGLYKRTRYCSWMDIIVLVHHFSVSKKLKTKLILYM
jgi:hypothetical protein